MPRATYGVTGRVSLESARRVNYRLSAAGKKCCAAGDGMNSDVQIACFTDPSFGENGYVVWRRDGGPCWIIDPGLPPSASQMLDHLRQKRLEPAAIVLTHAHADHIAGIPEILDAYPDLPICIAGEELPLLNDARHNLSADLGAPFAVKAAKTRDLPAGGTLELDDLRWEVRDVSGHSPGGRALYQVEAGIVIVGDALFAGSIGRTDFHHSDHHRLIRNIHENLLSLPDDTTVLSGHGPATTIGDERRTNPFLQA